MVDEDVKIPCEVCKNTFDHTEVFGGYEWMSEEEIEDLGLTNLLKNFPQLLKDWGCICEDCLSNDDNHKEKADE